MVRTTDGGSTWRSMRPPPANVALATCADPCIEGLRFANDRIGYAYGPDALFMTTDAGKSWQPMTGGADVLETLDGNVIRVSTKCLPGCDYSVQIAPIGSSAWHPVALPGPQTAMNSGAVLARTGSRAFIDVLGHVSGGAGNAESVLYSSADDGASWQRRGEPCQQTAGNEIDSIGLTSAADGSVTVLCARRGASSAQSDFTETSVDGGTSFHVARPNTLGSGTTAAWSASRSVLFAMNDVLYRSGDGGRSWRPVQHYGQGPLTASWIGFESATVGRAVSADGRTIWTTRNAGLTWTPHTFR
jgi:photosystem II stability/assembly factor-like uncharacterized protein